MTVSCPRCGTRYRLPPRSKLGPDPTYRCIECRHVFAADAAADGPALFDEGVQPELADGAPDVRAVREPANDGPDAVEEALDDADWSNEPLERPQRRPQRDEHDEETFSFEGEEEDEPRAEARRRRRRPEESEERAPATFVSSPVRFAVRTVLGVTLAYGVVSIYLYTHPDAVTSFLGRVPMIGGSLADKRLSPASIQLADVHGEYQRVKGDKLVFVISGTAINTSAAPVKGVQIEGRIIGKEEQHQIVFCGAAPRDVQELSIREIGLLQTLEPSRDWSLGAGEQASFLVAFVAPPVDVREFSAEVVGVQGRPRSA